MELEKLCATCREPLNRDEYSERKQSIFRATSCKRCNNLSKKQRDAIKAQKHAEVLANVRAACMGKL